MLSVLFQADFSWGFLSYSIVFAIVILYYLLLSKYMRAGVFVALARLVDRIMGWGLGIEHELKIGSIAFAFLSGTIFLNHVSYRSKNQWIRILQATIRFNWWATSVREGDHRWDEKLPCRLSIQLWGVEVLLHHNSSAYDHLTQVVEERSGKAECFDEPVAIDISDLMARKQGEQSIPLFYRWFPVSKCVIQRCAIMIGNITLPYFTVISLDEARIIHAIGSATSLHCYHQLTTKVTPVLNTHIYMQRNPEYKRREEILTMKRERDAEDYFALAMSTFGRLLKEWDTELAQLSEGDTTAARNTTFVRAYERGKSRADIGPLASWGHLIGRKRKSDVEVKTKEKLREEELSKQRELDRQRNERREEREQAKAAAEEQKQREKEKEDIMQCSEFHIEHVMDVTTLLVKEDVRALRKDPTKARTEAPIHRCKIMVKQAANFRYGPWMDLQRTLMLSYFNPWDYANQKVYKPKLGDYRSYAEMQFDMFFASESQIRVPFRELSRWIASGAIIPEIQTHDPPATGTGWVDLQFAAESGCHIISESIVHPGNNGNKVTIHANLTQLRVIPSLTLQPWIFAEHCSFRALLRYPLLWNSLYEWDFGMSLQSSRIFHLKEYSIVISDLITDWQSYIERRDSIRCIGDSSLTYFYPTRYTFEFDFTDFEFLFNVNENNIIDHVNNMQRNTYISIRGPDMSLIAKLPMTEYKARSSLLSYDCTVRNVHAHLRLPQNHPLFDLIESRNELQFLYLNVWRFYGEISSHYKHNADYRDSTTTFMKIEGAELDAYGYYLRYLNSLFDNYFGNFLTFVSSSQFKLAGYRNVVTHTRELAYHESEKRNAHETYFNLQVENLAVNLPDHLYSQTVQQPKARCYDLQLDFRSVLQYTDIYLTLAPVTVTVHSMFPSNIRQEDVSKRSWNEKETYLQVHDFSFNYHSSKGDLPRLVVFRNSTKLSCSEVRCQFFPQQLLALLTSFGHIAQQYRESINYSLPQVCPSHHLPVHNSADPLQLARAKLNLASYITDLVNYNMADYTVEVSIGVVRMNLLHPPLPIKLAPSQGAADINVLNKALLSSRLSVTRILVEDGIQFSTSSLITPNAHSRCVIEVPSISVAHMIANDDGTSSASAVGSNDSQKIPGDDEWLALADFRSGFVATISDRRSDCEAAMRKQQDFIYSQMRQDIGVDDHQISSWHESNAAKIPYTYSDEYVGQQPLVDASLLMARLIDTASIRQSARPSITHAPLWSHARKRSVEIQRAGLTLKNIPSLSTTALSSPIHRQSPFSRRNSAPTVTGANGQFTKSLESAYHQRLQEFVTLDAISDADEYDDEDAEDSYHSCNAIEDDRGFFESPKDDVEPGVVSTTRIELNEAHARKNKLHANVVVVGSQGHATNSLTAPLPIQCYHISPVPSVELQQYLAKETFESRTHHFLTTQAARFAASQTNTNVSHALFSTLMQNSATTQSSFLSADIAGTSEGAFMPMTFASFRSKRESHYIDETNSHSVPTASNIGNLELPTGNFYHNNHERTTSYDSNISTESLPTSYSFGFRGNSFQQNGLLDDLDVTISEEVENGNLQITNSHYVCIEAVRDVCATLTPCFIASLDHYIALLQPSHTSVEDTLDEIHNQICRVFGTSLAAELPSLIEDQPITNTFRFSLAVPRVYIELLQSAPHANFHLPLLSPQHRNRNEKPQQYVDLVYITTIAIDSLVIQTKKLYNIDEASFPSSDLQTTAESVNPFNSTQKLFISSNHALSELSSMASLKFTDIHIYSGILNAPSFVANLQATSNLSSYPNSTNPSEPASPHPESSVKTPLSTWQNVYGIQDSRLQSCLPSSVLSTTDIFISMRISEGNLQYTQIYNYAVPEPSNLTNPRSLGVLSVQRENFEESSNENSVQQYEDSVVYLESPDAGGSTPIMQSDLPVSHSAPKPPIIVEETISHLPVVDHLQKLLRSDPINREKPCHLEDHQSLVFTFNQVTVLANSDATERVTILGSDWLTASAQTDCISLLLEMRNASPESAMNELESEWASLLPGGPVFSAPRARWQTLLVFALQHGIHSRLMLGTRSGGKSISDDDQIHLLEWVHYRWFAGSRSMSPYLARCFMSNDAALSELKEFERSIVDVLAQYFISPRDYLPNSAFSNVPLDYQSSALPSYIQDELQHSDINPDNANYVLSSCLPLMISLRKLLRLPPSLMRSLNAKLQIAENGHNVNGPSVHYRANMNRYSFDKSKLFIFDKDKSDVPPLTLLSMTSLESLIPQAIKLMEPTSLSSMSPVLWYSLIKRMNLQILSAGNKQSACHLSNVSTETPPSRLVDLNHTTFNFVWTLTDTICLCIFTPSNARNIEANQTITIGSNSGIVDISQRSHPVESLVPDVNYSQDGTLSRSRSSSISSNVNMKREAMVFPLSISTVLIREIVVVVKCKDISAQCTPVLHDFCLSIFQSLERMKSFTFPFAKPSGDVDSAPLPRSSSGTNQNLNPFPTDSFEPNNTTQHLPTFEDFGAHPSRIVLINNYHFQISAGNATLRANVANEGGLKIDFDRLTLSSGSYVPGLQSMVSGHDLRMKQSLSPSTTSLSQLVFCVGSLKSLEARLLSNEMHESSGTSARVLLSLMSQQLLCDYSSATSVSISPLYLNPTASSRDTDALSLKWVQCLFTIPLFEMNRMRSDRILTSWKPLVDLFISSPSMLNSSTSNSFLNYAPKRTLFYASSISWVILPVPALMISYHVEKVWVKLNKIDSGSLSFMLAIGKEQQKEAGSRESSSIIPSQSSKPISHRLTLHVANVQGPDGANQSYGTGEENLTYDSRPQTAGSGRTVGESSYYSGDKNIRQPNYGASIYSHMQCVLEIALPTMRVYLNKHAQATSKSIGLKSSSQYSSKSSSIFNGQLDPVVAAQLVRLANEQSNQDFFSDDYESQEDSRTSTNHMNAYKHMTTQSFGDASTNLPKRNEKLIPSQGDFIGTVAVGNISNRIDETVLTRLLQLQSTVTAELNEIYLSTKSSGEGEGTVKNPLSMQNKSKPSELALLSYMNSLNVKILVDNISFEAGLQNNLASQIRYPIPLHRHESEMQFHPSWDPLLHLTTGTFNLSFKYNTNDTDHLDINSIRPNIIFGPPLPIISSDFSNLRPRKKLLVGLKFDGIGAKITTSGRERSDFFTFLLSGDSRSSLMQVQSWVEVYALLNMETGVVDTAANAHQSILKIHATDACNKVCRELYSRYSTALDEYRTATKQLFRELNDAHPTPLFEAHSNLWKGLRTESDTSALDASSLSSKPKISPLTRSNTLQQSKATKSKHFSRYNFKFSAEDSEMILLFEHSKPIDISDIHPYPQHTRMNSEFNESMSLFGGHHSRMSTILSRDFGSDAFITASRQLNLSAIVLFMSELSIRSEYIPASTDASESIANATVAELCGMHVLSNSIQASGFELAFLSGVGENSDLTRLSSLTSRIRLAASTLMTAHKLHGAPPSPSPKSVSGQHQAIAGESSVPHCYNRVVIRSSSLSISATLPGKLPNGALYESGTIYQDFTNGIPLLRELTVMCSAESTGCEIFVDPTIVHHLNNLRALSNLIPSINRSAPSNGVDLQPNTNQATFMSNNNSMFTPDDGYLDSPRSFASAESISPRSKYDDEYSDYSEFQQLGGQAPLHQGRDVRHIPNDCSSDNSSQAAVSTQKQTSFNYDITIEMELIIESGHCALYPVPNRQFVASILQGSEPMYSDSSESSSIGNALDEDGSSRIDASTAFVDISLPMIACTYVSRLNDKTNHIIMIDINMPPVTLSPALISFIHHIKREIALLSTSINGTKSAATGSTISSGYQTPSNNTAFLPPSLLTSAPTISATEISATESSLDSFLASCRKNSQSLHFTVRIRPTSVKFNCLPHHKGVYITFGTKKPLDLCLSVSTLTSKETNDGAWANNPPDQSHNSSAISMISLTAQLSSLFIHLGIASSLFFALRCHHMRTHWAYSHRSDKLHGTSAAHVPIRTFIFHIDQVNNATVNVSSCGAAVVLIRTWINPFQKENQPDSTSAQPIHRHQQSQKSPIYLTILACNKIAVQVNMLDINSIHNQSTLMVKEVQLRSLQLLPYKSASLSHPLILSASCSELILASQPDLDGLDGVLNITKGIRLSIVREYEHHMFELLIHPIHLSFGIANGGGELIKGETDVICWKIVENYGELVLQSPSSPTTESKTLSQFSPPTLNSPRFREPTSSIVGRWMIQTEISFGEQVLVSLNSRALPYFIDLIATLIEYLQLELSKLPTTIEIIPILSLSKASHASTTPNAPEPSFQLANRISKICNSTILTGRQVEMKLTAEEERDSCVLIMVQYSFNLTRQMINPNDLTINDSRLKLFTDSTLRSNERALYRSLLIDVGEHQRVDERNGGLIYRPSTHGLRSSSEGIFLYRYNVKEDAYDSIIKVPGFVLEMNTVEEKLASLIRSQFNTWWDKAMTVNVDPRVYRFIKSMNDSFLNRYTNAMHKVHAQAALIKDEILGSNRRSSTIATSAKSKNVSLNDRQMSASVSSHLPPPQKRVDPLGFFDLHNPQIHVLDNTSGGVSIKRILDIFGIKGIDSTVIPNGAHGITLALEQVAHFSESLSDYLDRTL